jgi:hypothetical protein
MSRKRFTVEQIIGLLREVDETEVDVGFAEKGA